MLVTVVVYETKWLAHGELTYSLIEAVKFAMAVQTFTWSMMRLTFFATQHTETLSHRKRNGKTIILHALAFSCNFCF